MDLCDKSNDGRPCTDPETEEPCAQCEAAQGAEAAHWLREYQVASPADRDPAGYARDMIDGGRGHMLTEEEKGMVRG